MNDEAFDRVSFVGGGRVTRFLLEGWQRADALPAEILVCDPDEAVLARLQSDFPRIQACSLSDATRTPLVFLAVHPPDLKAVLGEMKEDLSPTTLVLSLAPKVTIAAIQSVLGVRLVARMIPNAPSAIGRGYNPVTLADDVGPAVEQKLQRLFAPWGESPGVPESDLEAYAIMSAMGPTYMWFQWQALRELAAGFGLAKDAADAAILKMIVGAAECLMAYGKDAESVIDMVPVKPLQADEELFRTAYSTRLTALYEKLRA